MSPRGAIILSKYSGKRNYNASSRYPCYLDKQTVKFTAFLRKNMLLRLLNGLYIQDSAGAYASKGGGGRPLSLYASKKNMHVRAAHQ